jgi:hypothetical protein
MSLTLREEYKLRIGLFENVVQMSIFVSKREKLTGGWRKLHNEEFRNFYTSPNRRIIRIKLRSMKWMDK